MLKSVSVEKCKVERFFNRKWNEKFSEKFQHIFSKPKIFLFFHQIRSVALNLDISYLARELSPPPFCDRIKGGSRSGKFGFYFCRIFFSIFKHKAAYTRGTTMRFFVAQ